MHDIWPSIRTYDPGSSGLAKHEGRGCDVRRGYDEVRGIDEVCQLGQFG